MNGDDNDETRRRSESRAPTVSGAPPDVASGSHVAGRYRIDAIEGQGGFGTVHRAWDEKLGRVVALKTIALRGNAAESGLGALLDEARTAAKLDHPNIVPVYDTGIETGGAWLVMRLIKGTSMGALLARDKRAPLTC